MLACHNPEIINEYCLRGRLARRPSLAPDSSLPSNHNTKHEQIIKINSTQRSFSFNL